MVWVWVWPRLVKIVNRFKLIGAGARQMRLEEDDDYRYFDITRYEEGIDCANF